MTQNDRIDFSCNWNNKLTGAMYTTLRIASSKYKLGKTFDVYMNKRFLHSVVLLEVTHIKLEKVNNYISGLDMGYEAKTGKEIIQKMYPSIDFTQKNLAFCLLKVIPSTISKEPKPKEQ